MSYLIIQLGWLALRVGLVALAALAVTACVSRRAARSGVVVLAGAVILLLVLSATAFMPFPAAWTESISEPASALPSSVRLPDNVATPDAAPPPQAGFKLADVSAWLGKLTASVPQEPAWPWGWNALLAVYGAGMAWASLRLLRSWRAIRALCRRSRPIADAHVLEQADALRRALGCTRPVELRQCDEPGLAATVGWRRPIVLLPPEWRTWTDAELRVVLAHELGHVRNGDYLVGMFTRLCLVFYFYHPLVRWLARRLRWHQEVAADALAALQTGGRACYRKVLAQLALRLPARTPAAAASPLSAMTGGVLLRRIHMLSGNREQRPLSCFTHAVFVGLIAGVALFASTLRSAGIPPAPPAAETTKDDLEPIELGYIAPDAKGLLVVRPSQWRKQPGMNKLDLMIAAAIQELKKTGLVWPDDLKVENVEQIVANLHLGSAGTGEPKSRSLMFGTSSLLVRTSKEIDWVKFLGSLCKDLKEIRHDSVTIYSLGVVPMLGPVPIHFHMPDRKSIVFSAAFFHNPKRDAKEREAKAVERFVHLIKNTAKARARDWGAGWKKVERAPLAVVLDNQDAYYTKTFRKDLEAAPDLVKVVENLRFVTLGIELGDGRPMRLVLEAKSDAAVAATEKAAADFMKAIESEVLREAKTADGMDKIWLQWANDLLRSRRLRRDGACLEWTAFSPLRARDFLDAVDLRPDPE